ncbi:hypothetical protein [Lysobacter gummosus]|uniref:hypothetical protein n=1 Tax=Lysobacter gummosus TaxID=262324 RepID=UPI0036331C00
MWPSSTRGPKPRWVLCRSTHWRASPSASRRCMCRRRRRSRPTSRRTGAEVRADDHRGDEAIAAPAKRSIRANLPAQTKSERRSGDDRRSAADHRDVSLVAALQNLDFETRTAIAARGSRK